MRLLTALLASTFALPANGQAQLLPAGEFAARDGRPGPGRTWKLDDERGRALAKRWNDTAAATELPFDYDHQTLNVDKHGQLAPASGWSPKAEWRDGVGLFADVRWTKKAQALIDGEEYRYISPVIEFDEDTGEVQAVLMASLVNYPALTGMHPAVARLSAQFAAQPSPTDPSESKPMNEILKALLAALGLSETATKEQATAALSALIAKAAVVAKPSLPAALSTALGVGTDADEAAVLAAVTKLKAPVDSASIATIAALQAQVAALSTKMSGDEVTRIVDAALAANKLLPAQRDWALQLGKTDLAQLNAFVAAAPVIPLGRQTNEGHEGSGGAGTEALSAAQTMLAKQLGLDPVAYAKHLKEAAASAAA